MHNSYCCIDPTLKPFFLDLTKQVNMAQNMLKLCLSDAHPLRHSWTVQCVSRAEQREWICTLTGSVETVTPSAQQSDSLLLFSTWLLADYKVFFFCVNHNLATLKWTKPYYKLKSQVHFGVYNLVYTRTMSRLFIFRFCAKLLNTHQNI